MGANSVHDLYRRAHYLDFSKKYLPEYYYSYSIDAPSLAGLIKGVDLDREDFLMKLRTEYENIQETLRCLPVLTKEQLSINIIEAKINKLNYYYDMGRKLPMMYPNYSRYQIFLIAGEIQASLIDMFQVLT